MAHQNLYDELEAKIKILRETTWYDRQLEWPEVQRWLDQFQKTDDDDDEQIQCLFLLSNFMYFGRREIRETLRALFRDLYKYPIMQELRKKNANTKDRNLLEREFQKVLDKTRFLGMGNPSESGTHLLYFFRQENNLSKDHFINGHDIFLPESRRPRSWNRRHIIYSILRFFKLQTLFAPLVLRDDQIKRYVFIDDLCCSGSQARKYSENLVESMKLLDSEIEVYYFALFATQRGMDYVRTYTAFDKVDCIFELDETYKCFSANSRFFRREPHPVDKSKSEAICRRYDSAIKPGLVLGYNQDQLLLGFYHNTPDNTPPIFWYDGTYSGNKLWRSIFHRYHKIY
ncbi:MAG TPA: hypothetical protein VHD33_06320 [Legionellaceae bacterium]|nr:hypothetical protein [Legionellaceae bacterium]